MRILSVIRVLVLCWVVFHLSAKATLVFNEALFQKVQARFGNDAVKRVRDWQELLDDNATSGIPDQLYEVNRFFNQL
ncbi:MAG: transglutaminase, partial [Paraglaciecola sp.]|nr:transglutaminase [Paraglaciecola sp.]